MTNKDASGILKTEAISHIIPEVREALWMGANALEQEPCDCISRELVLRELDKYLCGVPFDEKGIDEVIKDLPSVQPKAEQEPKTWWIPVSERLPEECIKVLVWERYYSYKRERDVYDYNFGWIYDDNWFCDGGGETEVIAWMPLPAPFEPQESEEQK